MVSDPGVFNRRGLGFRLSGTGFYEPRVLQSFVATRVLLLCQSDGGLWGLRLKSTRAWGLGFTGKAFVFLWGSLGIRAYHKAPTQNQNMPRKKLGASQSWCTFRS